MTATTPDDCANDLTTAHLLLVCAFSAWPLYSPTLLLKRKDFYYFLQCLRPVQRPRRACRISLECVCYVIVFVF